MENSKHLPEPFRIRVIEPAKRTARTYRKEAIIKSGTNPFLLNNEDMFIDLSTDGGTGATTRSMQAAMMRGDEAYSGSRSYYVLAESVKDTFGYQYIIPTHQGRGVEQIYIPILIKKREQEKGLDCSKVVTFSNCFFGTTQGHSQINGYIVRNVYTKEAFDADVCYDSKGDFGLEGLERGIEEVGPSNAPYIVATVISNSAGGQPVSLVNSKAACSIAKEYGIPVAMGSARFTESTYLIEQREMEYKDWTIEQITRETYKYAGMLAISAKKDAMVPMDGLLCMKGDGLFDVHTECRTPCMIQGGFPTYDGLEDGAMERLAVGLYDGMNLGWLTYRTAQVQYLANGLKKIDAVYQQADGHATFTDIGKLLPYIPTDQFPTQTLACELYKATGIRTIEIGSFLLGHDPKTGKRLPCPAELLRLIIPRTTCIQTRIDPTIEALKHVGENTMNTRGSAFTYGPKVLHHFITKLEKV